MDQKIRKIKKANMGPHRKREEAQNNKSQKSQAFQKNK